jgi:hypothetical protein
MVAHDALAQSEKSQQPGAPTAQQQPQPEQRGTERAPFIVKIEQPPQTQEKPDQNSEKRPDERGDGWLSGWGLSDRIAAVSIVVAALQFAALIATVWVMVLNGRRQLRAYIFPESLGLYDGTNLDNPLPDRANDPFVSILFRNSGQTPAFKVISWARIDVIEPVNEKILVIPPLQNLFPTWIGADGKMPKGIWFGRKLTDAEIADIMATTKCIYVYGRIEYRDIFKRKRFTTFRLAYAGQYPAVPGQTFNFCADGNDAS